MIKSRSDSFTRKLIGETLQKHTVSRILAHFPELSVQDVQSQKMSVRGEDILLTDKAKDILSNPSYETKSKKSGYTPCYDAIKQCKRQANAEEMPLAIIHDPKENDLLAIITLEDLLKLKRLYAKAKGIL